MDDKDKITIDRETFKALAADSRIDILKSLEEHKLTLSDLSQKLSMSPSTVKEHLDRLTAAGLIELIPGDTKLKYYKLTWKGRNILNPYETKVWFVLGISALALVGVVYNLFTRIIDFNLFMLNSFAAAPAGASQKRDTAKEVAESGAVMLSSKSAEIASTTTTMAEALQHSEIVERLNGIPLAEVALALLLAAVVGLCAGYLMKKRKLF